MTDLRKAYAAQKQLAKRRGIGWELTFEQWWDIWQKSGKYEQRGVRRGQYVMARNWDAGPYAVWNVDIQLSRENARTVEYRRQYKRIRPSGGRLADPLPAYGADPLEQLLEQEENCLHSGSGSGIFWLHG